jgi:predicted transcriptional regulator of viral defense system
MSVVAQKIMRLGLHGPFRSRELDRIGVPRTALKPLVDAGIIERIDRGLYRAANSPITEQRDLADLQVRCPRSCICLLSALQFHQMTTESPSAIWAMLPVGARTPAIASVRVEWVRASGESLTHGVEMHRVGHVKLHVTSRAKTVADCFRFRRHVGLDTAIAALKHYVEERHSIDALFAAATAARVAVRMRPYVEAVT